MVRIGGQDNNRAGNQNVSTNDKTREKQDGSKQVKQDGVNDKQDKKGKGTIFAGELNLGQNDLLAKKEQMQKTAMQVILDAFAGDTKLDENVEEHMDKAQEFAKQADEASGEVNNIRELKQNLQKSYSIDADSDEQKDLELLEKSKDIRMGFSNSTLTKEEEERLKDMGPLTEYQQAALNYHDMELVWRQRLTKANDKIFNEHRTIESIQLGRVKYHPLIDAKKESQDLLESASKELVNGLVGEAKDTIDDKIGDDSDKAQEVKDKDKKAQEEAAKAANKKSEAKKAKKPNNAEVPTTETVEREIDWEKLKLEAKATADKANLLLEDLKGLTVDEQI